jgi:hypothetical protein
VVSAGCQENCQPTPGPAWQRNAQLALALIGLALLLGALNRTAYRRHSAAFGLVAAAGACFAGWVASVGPLGDRFGV